MIRAVRRETPERGRFVVLEHREGAVTTRTIYLDSLADHIRPGVSVRGGEVMLGAGTEVGAGEKETGVTLHHMDVKPDHGDIVAQQRVPIARDDTALTLTRKLAAAARVALREAVPLLEKGVAQRIVQDHARSSYFGGRRPSDGEIDWRQPAESIRNLIRAVTHPWPGAYSTVRHRKLLVWRAETRAAESARSPGEIWLAEDGSACAGTGEGALELVEVSREAGDRISGSEWVRSEKIRSGERFEPAP